MPVWFERSVVVAGLLAAAVLVAVNVRAWRDYREEDPRLQPRTTTTAGPEDNAAPGETTQTKRPFAGGTNATPAALPAAVPRLLVQAARGDSWLEIRAGSENGAIRYRGTLLEGREVRLTGARLWLRIGAGENLDVLLNGKRAEEVPAGTATVVVTAGELEVVGIG